MGDGSVDCTILGGGIAGLAAACAAQELGISFVLYEAGPRPGGNAVTLQHGDFRFDAGAHRFHDCIPEVTRKIKSLLGEDLHIVDTPSRIKFNGTFVDFPLSPGNLLSKLSAGQVLKASLDLVRARLRWGRGCRNLEEYAVKTYGKTIARSFLTNYSEKLWGVASRTLSTAAAGKRLSGLTWKTFLLEALQGAGARTAHLDGKFYYPRGGIGRIPEVLAKKCPVGTLQTGVPVKAIHHDNHRIAKITTAGAPVAGVDRVICTLPLCTTLKLLDPPPPERILALSKTLHFRHVVVVALFLDRDVLSRYATTYFPQKDCFFTRVHEPRCRCPEMSPPGTTSLVAEIPCDPNDETWCLPDEELEARVRVGVEQLGWIKAGEIRSAAVHRMHDAYPVPVAGSEDVVREIHAWLGRFSNLTLIGRGSLFAYHHIHDLVHMADQAVEALSSPSGRRMTPSV